MSTEALAPSVETPLFVDPPASTLLDKINNCIASAYPQHPFNTSLVPGNIESVLAEYLAMSISFPYLQAGAIHENFRRTISADSEVTSNLEISSIVGSFLVWDEFGGHQLALKYGNEGLRHIVATKNHFHSNLLRRDLRQLLGHEIVPKWGTSTKRYLGWLFDELSHAEANRNIAAMVAFEKHAHEMIDALWTSLHVLYNVPKDDRLAYFHEHVGGDSPAEAFHVEMTQKMVAHLVPSQSHPGFIDLVVGAYGHSLQWCNEICNDVDMSIS